MWHGAMYVYIDTYIYIYIYVYIAVCTHSSGWDLVFRGHALSSLLASSVSTSASQQRNVAELEPGRDLIFIQYQRTPSKPLPFDVIVLRIPPGQN